MRLTKVLAKEKLSGFPGRTLQKLCFRGTLENLKHALSLDDARNWKGGKEALKQKLETYKKILPFVTQFQPSLYQTWKTYLWTNGI